MNSDLPGVNDLPMQLFSVICVDIYVQHKSSSGCNCNMWAVLNNCCTFSLLIVTYNNANTRFYYVNIFDQYKVKQTFSN